MKKTILDANTATSLAAYAFSENVAIYPITPSSTMAENIDQWASEGKQNLFGEVVKVNQLQSEAGVAGTIHGLLSAGSLASTFTSSQGLLLMIPNMFKIAGECLPTVFHVSARAVASHALSIFGDHSDVMATRGTGFAQLCSASVQEAHDFAVACHIACLKAKVPFMHFFDGFRTSHEIKKISVFEEAELKKLVDYNSIKTFKNSALNSQNPVCRGTAQNPDTFFQNREAREDLYRAVPEIVKNTFKQLEEISGRKHELFKYYGQKNAKVVAVVLGSASETLASVSKKFNCGVVSVKLFRPFSIVDFLNVVPTSCKTLVVLDRTKEDGCVYEPLCQDVISAVSQSGRKIKVIGGRFGLGGKDFTPGDAASVFKNALSKKPKDHFTVGINDDVNFSSLKSENYEQNENCFSCKFFGLGSDGTVSANKNSLKILGELLGKEVQGYFEYDSKKSGSITTSHMRISENEIMAPYLVNDCNFIACHHPSFIGKFEFIKELKNGGTFLLNTPLNAQQLNKFLPSDFKFELKKKKAKFFTIDAFSLANELGLKGKINLIMQSAFFYLSNLIDFETAKTHMKAFAKTSYEKKGKEILDANIKAIESAQNFIKQVDVLSFNDEQNIISKNNVKDKYYNEFILPIIKRRGDNLPVSAFAKNGEVPTGTTRFEKRGICGSIPNWNSEKCVQCGMCAFVCPHSCIRPVLVKKGTKKPDGFVCVDAQDKPGFEYRMQVSALDCTGCGHCAYVCPTKAIKMENPTAIIEKETNNYEFSQKIQQFFNVDEVNNVRELQFKKPLFEFCGACSGCGETSYIKILTQLYGDHLIVANATGCSSIYGANSPTCPYAKNEHGCGPAWQNSLFEDNAEFGFGLYLAYKARREKIKNNLIKLKEFVLDDEQKLIKNYIKNFNSYEKTKVLAPKIEEICKKYSNNSAKTVLLEKNALVKQTFWIIGGDGWAYDIGFGGLEHVLSQEEDIRVLVLDTNVYSNTGGQMSSATPIGAVAKFATSGKARIRKNLAQIIMSNPNVYVAQIAYGANPMQTLNAFKEAEAHKGSSLIIAYAQCINQGFDLSLGLQHQKDIVACGLWNLFRYNPGATQKFSLDYKILTKTVKDFYLSENRFKSLLKTNPKRFEELCEKAQENVNLNLEKLKKLQ